MGNISENAQRLLREKNYYREGENGWDDICRRVSKDIASAEETDELRGKYEEEFFNAMNGLYFIPSTPCLLNAGTKTQQLSSCFVVDIDDSIESIMSTLAECAKIFQKSGGAGFNISNLRPEGSSLGTSGGYASGPVSFMNLFNRLIEEVKHGNSRKGALKVDLDISHPEIYKFIHCKNNTDLLQNMNISVSITNNFMNAVINNKNWDLKFNGEVHETVKAKDLWNEIVESAWRTGEPGVSFIDVMNNDNMNPHLGKIKGSNPCQEFTNIPYSSCNLASINLLKAYDNLEKYIRLGVRFLDNMITVNKLPLPEIQQVTDDIRPIGLGTMGLADLLFKLKIPMNSKKGYNFIDELYSRIKTIATDESVQLAKERGVYPKWEGSKWEEQGIEIRNSSLLSIAPTGSIAIIADVNSSIEPVFALSYTRITGGGNKYKVLNPVFEKEINRLKLNKESIKNSIMENNGSVQGLNNISKKLQKIFITATDMTPDEHLKILNIISKHVDLSVSKTVNLPKSSTVEDISNIYINAWKTNNIKGVTVYRDGSRKNQILSIKEEQDLGRGEIKVAPQVSEDSKTARLSTGCGNLYITMTKNEEGKIDQTFVAKGSKGTCLSNQTALSRLISLSLRGGINLDDVIDQLLSTPICASYYGKRCKGERVSKGSNCPSAIAYQLQRYEKESKDDEKNEYYEKCPECDEKGLIFTSGCVSCISCGFNRCN